MIKAALEGNQVDVFLDNEHIQSLTYGISSIVSLSPAIYVPAKDADIAKQILAEYTFQWNKPWIVSVNIGGCFCSGIEVVIALENGEYKVNNFSIG